MGLDLDVAGVESFIKARMGKVIDMDGCIGPIDTFIVEPFVPHAQVLATLTTEDHTIIRPALPTADCARHSFKSGSEVG